MMADRKADLEAARAIADARQRKAERLAHAARVFMRPEQLGLLAELDQPGRDALAGLAQVRPPSEETWALMCRIVNQRCGNQTDKPPTKPKE